MIGIRYGIKVGYGVYVGHGQCAITLRTLSNGCSWPFKFPKINMELWVSTKDGILHGEQATHRFVVIVYSCNTTYASKHLSEGGELNFKGYYGSRVRTIACSSGHTNLNLQISEVEMLFQNMKAALEKTFLCLWRIF